MSAESPPAAKPPRVVRWAVPILFVLGVGSVLAAIFLPVPTRRPPTDDARPVPDFALTERSGRTVTKADLAGKVWVASFMFTRCSGPCPRVTGTMHRLERELDLAGKPDLRLVTFTMDPEYDTPEVLRRYAKQIAQTDSDRWLFLTGPEDQMHRLIKTGFRIAVDKNPNPEPGREYNHTTYLIAVDKKGRARGHFEGFPGEHDADGKQFEDSLAQLKQTVADLLAE